MQPKLSDVLEFLALEWRTEAVFLHHACRPWLTRTCVFARGLTAAAARGFGVATPCAMVGLLGLDSDRDSDEDVGRDDILRILITAGPESHPFPTARVVVTQDLPLEMRVEGWPARSGPGGGGHYHTESGIPQEPAFFRGLVVNDQESFRSS